MKRAFFLNSAIVLSVMFLSASARTAEEKIEVSKNSVPAFETLKALAGTWTGKEIHRNRKGDETVRVKYEVTSAGSAIIEMLYLGTPNEMVSVYYLDGSNVKMTHFCTLGNQPHMSLSSAKKKERRLDFKFIDATGMKSPNEPHLGAFTLWVKDSNHLQLEKVMWMEGGKKKYVRNLNFVREK